MTARRNVEAHSKGQTRAPMQHHGRSNENRMHMCSPAKSKEQISSKMSRGPRSHLGGHQNEQVRRRKGNKRSSTRRERRNTPIGETRKRKLWQ